MVQTTTVSQTAETLKSEVENILRRQGYTVQDGSFFLSRVDRDEKRAVHTISRAERITEHIKFIESFFPKAKEFMLNDTQLDVSKIKPKLIEVKTGTIHAELFRWWNLTWWSLPYERSYGRQMRFVVWDEYHNAPIGLIGLQSPILSWNVRDRHLGITPEKRDFWVNQSMNAQRLGALPPYNKFLGGKLVASLLASDVVRQSFHNKYKDYETLLKKRVIPANLLFITTTGAYGKSSVYNRLRFDNDKICEFIGYTNGSGSFHIPNTLYEGFVSYLRDSGAKVGRSFGNGPSVKMKIIDEGMRLLGFRNGSDHGVKRSVYLFPFAKNVKEVIQNGEEPVWYGRSVDDLTRYWKERWAVKRTENYQLDKLRFSKEEFISNTEQDLKECRRLIRQ